MQSPQRRTTHAGVLAGAMYTSGHPLEIGPKSAHFFSLFGPSGVTFQRRTSIRKSFHAKQIEPDSWSSRASKTPCGTWDPKFSYRFRLIVHYLRRGAWTVERGPWTVEEEVCKNHRTQLALPCVRLKNPQNRPFGTTPVRESGPNRVLHPRTGFRRQSLPKSPASFTMSSPGLRSRGRVVKPRSGPRAASREARLPCFRTFSPGRS